MILVAGATGVVGGAACRLLVEQGREVRALVRTTSDPARVAALRSLGADIVEGDLQAADSLARACAGVSAVISTATATGGLRQPTDSVVTVDGEGQMNLVEAAAAAGVGHFVFVSFSGNLTTATPLSRSKRGVEQRLREGDIPYTILRPSAFMEIWLSPLVGFDVPAGQLTIYGAGTAPVSYISQHDVTRAIIASLDTEAAWNRTIQLGGPEAVPPLQAVRIAEEVTGREMAVQHVPAEALRAQHESATDPLQKSFAGLMLSLAEGDVIDMAVTSPMLGLESRSVRTFMESAYGAAAPDAGGASPQAAHH